MRKLGRLSGTALAVLPALLSAPEPARALDLFGIHLFGAKAAAPEPVSADAQRYTVTVNAGTTDKDLKARIEGASLLYSERDNRPPPSTAAFLSRVGAEYGRITAGLYSDGYYGGNVVIRVDGRDPDTIAPDAQLPNPVSVEIEVDPGPRFVFGPITIQNRAPANADADPGKEDTREAIGLVTGNIARSGTVLQSEEALVAEWRAEGYPKAKIAKRDVLADHESRTLAVTITVDPGRAAVYGPITVTGTEKMDPDFVIRESGLRSGERFDPVELGRAQKRLQQLQVFNATRITEGHLGSDGRLPITITVVERKLHIIGGGVSYSTVDGVGLDAYWEKRNLFGHAERLRLEGRVGGINGTDPTDFSYLLAATFTKPGVINPQTDLIASLIAKRDVLDAYTEKSLQGRAGLSHAFSETLTGTVAANAEYDKDDDVLGKREFQLASLPLGLAYDGTDNTLNPTRGIRAKAQAEPFYEFNYGNAGVITDIRASSYLSLGADDRFILAARLGAGSIAGAPADEIPDGRLFFLGGGSSIRGYGYRNVGPRLSSGDLIGGRSYVDGSLELRIKVTDTIGIVPFVDAGNAFLSSLPDFSGEMKIGAGLGLRYQTALGPIRVDVAMPVNPEPSDPSFALYVGLGQAF